MLIAKEHLILKGDLTGIAGTDANETIALFEGSSFTRIAVPFVAAQNKQGALAKIPSIFVSHIPWGNFELTVTADFAQSAALPFSIEPKPLFHSIVLSRPQNDSQKLINEIKEPFTLTSLQDYFSLTVILRPLGSPVRPSDVSSQPSFIASLIFMTEHAKTA